MTSELQIVPKESDAVAEITSLHASIIGDTRSTLYKAIRIGELLSAQRATMKHGQWLPWIKDNLPFTQKTTNNYMRVFERRDELETISNLELTDAYRLLSSGAHVSQNSVDDEWYTPEQYIVAARQVLGRIDLDPASNEEANAVVKAKRFFTEKDDGLQQEWRGRVWMNPPYASELIGLFCERLGVSFQAGTVKEAIALVNNATETAWFQALSEHASALCFPKGRVKFWHPRKESATPLQGQSIVYLGGAPKRFTKAFHEFGICCLIQ